MSLFESLGEQGQQGQQDMRGEVSRIQQNPGAYLQQRGFSIPQGMKDPRQITQHLLRTGQVGGQKLQAVMRMLGR